MGNPYREGEAGLRARAAELEGALRRREAELSDFFWQEVADTVGLGQPIADERGSEEPPSARVARLEERLRALDEVLESLPELTGTWLEPSEVPPRPLWWPEFAPRGDRSGSAPQHRAWYDAVAEAAGSSEPPLALPDGGVGARFVAKGLPLCVTVAGGRAAGAGVTEDGEAPTVRMRTPVARATGAVKVAPWPRGGAWLRRHLIRGAVTTADQAFDRALGARGDGATARELLSDRVRGALLILHTDGQELELSISRRLASLSWRGSEDRPGAYRHAFRSAFEVLRAAHSLRVRGFMIRARRSPRGGGA